MDSVDRADVLTPSEVEMYCGAIEASSFEDLGTLRWLDKHDRIEKLTMQATVQALTNREETVKEMLISMEKLQVILQDLILVEVWRELLLPKLLSLKPECGISIQTILYHEATCMSLIETVLFHPEAVETLGDGILDLVDYCSHALNSLLAVGPPSSHSSSLSSKSHHVAENGESLALKEQVQTIRFKVAFKALCCLRFIIEQLDNISSQVLPRLVVNTDTPMLLTSLIMQKPWVRRTERMEEEYNADEQRWVPTHGNFSKIEAQAWLALYQILLHERVASMYDITEYRKTQLLQLRPYIHETFVDHIPVLGHFQKWLDHLAIGAGQAPPPKSPLIIEMMSAIRPQMTDYANKHRQTLVDLYTKEFVHPPRELITAKAQRLSETYNFEHMEAVLPPSRCANCGDHASKRCSRCRNEWYCGRKCQVEHWGKHKKVCDLISG